MGVFKTEIETITSLLYDKYETFTTLNEDYKDEDYFNDITQNIAQNIKGFKPEDIDRTQWIQDFLDSTNDCKES